MNENNYCYYSKILKEPFETKEELKEAEEAYFAKQKAKEDVAAKKKADAIKVEEAFKELNAARKLYKEELTECTKWYSEELVKLKKDFEAAKKKIEASLAAAEENFTKAHKAFTAAHPEGYHLTLKDGDFETTISGGRQVSEKAPSTAINSIFDLLFNF